MKLDFKTVTPCTEDAVTEDDEDEYLTETV